MIPRTRQPLTCTARPEFHRVKAQREIVTGVSDTAKSPNGAAPPNNGTINIMRINSECSPKLNISYIAQNTRQNAVIAI